MWEGEISRFLILGVVLLLLIIIATIVFIFEYRRRIIVNDIEKAKLNEQHKQELIQKQLEVQQYIGREIHDNVGQQLTLAALYTQQINHERKYPQINDRIVAVIDIINGSLSDLRSLSKSLTDDYIAQTDLITLLKNESQKINSAEGNYKVEFSYTPSHINTSYSVKSVVVRIVQEFLQNSLKHSACTTISMEIILSNNELNINISDNGKGFLVAEISGKGIGLLNIKRRADVIEASVLITSTPDKGTNMQLIIPANKLN